MDESYDDEESLSFLDNSILKELALERERRRKRARIESGEVSKEEEDTKQGRMGDIQTEEEDEKTSIGLDRMIVDDRLKREEIEAKVPSEENEIVILDKYNGALRKQLKKNRETKIESDDDDDDGIIVLNSSEDDDEDVIDITGLDVMIQKREPKYDKDDVIDLVNCPDVVISRSRVKFENVKDEIMLLGKMKCECVGMQHHNGIVRKGESVSIVREPYNRYDKNAVRVNNAKQLQLGYISRDQAAIISKVMDQKPTIKIKATACSDRIFTFANIELSFHGRVQDESFLKNTIGKQLLQTGTRFHLPFMNRPPPNITTTTTTTTTTSTTLNGRNSNNEIDLTWAPSNMHWGQADNDWAFGEEYEFDEEASKKELDDMFDELAEELDISNLKFDQKRQAPGLVTTLKKHQVQGVAWMLKRERQPTNSLPQLYTEKTSLGVVKYKSDITGAVRKRKPKLVLGGLVAGVFALDKLLSLSLSLFEWVYISPTL